MRLAPRLTILALSLLLRNAGLTDSAGAQLTSLGAELLDQCDVPQPGFGCETDDRFAEAFAVGDFNGDGFDDLVVGIPGEHLGFGDENGIVEIYPGAPDGVDKPRMIPVDRPIGSIGDLNRFGAALAAGDFNGDGFDDLALGIPGEDTEACFFPAPPLDQSGEVRIIFGSAAGLVLGPTLLLNQCNLPGDGTEPLDRFGSVLAVCRHSGLDFDKLVIGIPEEDLLALTSNQGVIMEVDLNPDSPAFKDAVLFHQDSAGIADSAESDDRFGAALGCADFDGDGSDDLAIGVPGEDLPGANDAGAVTVLYGGELWLAASGSQFFSQEPASVEDFAETGDLFGTALAAGDFDNDGHADLAIGVPGEDLAAVNAGAANVIYGSASGLSAESGDQLWHQGLMADESQESGDLFGERLAAADLDGDGIDDLGIGAPAENLPGGADAGVIHALYGRSGFGLDVPGRQTFHADSPDAPDSANPEDEFGLTLAAGDFDGNGVADLAVGVPGEAFSVLGGVTDGGQATILYSLARATDSFGFVRFVSTSISVPENTGTIQVQVSRTGGAVVVATVDHLRNGGSATPGSDFTYTAGELSWPVGDLANRSIPVSITNDTLDESSETIQLHLQFASDGTHVQSPGGTLTITVTDNDEGGVVEFQAPAQGFAESAAIATVVVTRTGGAASGVTVQYATANGTAVSGEDFVAESGTLVFAAGEVSKTIEVALLDDPTDEPSEAFFLALSNAAGGATLGARVLTTVVLGDDDPSNQIFLDGFETGDTLRWSSTVQ